MSPETAGKQTSFNTYPMQNILKQHDIIHEFTVARFSHFLLFFFVRLLYWIVYVL